MIIRPRGTVTIPNRPRSLGGVLSWTKDVTAALKQLRDRPFVVGGGGRKSGKKGRFIVSLSGQNLSVSKGAVFFGDGDEPGRTIDPIEPTLDNVILSENPFWDVTSKPNDVLHKVRVVLNRYNYNARVELNEDGEAPDLNDQEIGVNIAEVTFKAVDGGRGAEIHQMWESDIAGWKGGDFGSSGSFSEDESSGSVDDSRDDSSDDSSTIIDDSSGDDSSDESSDDDPDSGGIICPWLEILSVDIMDPDCFIDGPDDDPYGECQYVTIRVKLIVGPITETTCEPYVRLSVAGGPPAFIDNVYGPGDKTFYKQVTFYGCPLGSYTVTARILHPLTSQPGCMGYNACAPATFDFTTPGTC